MSTTSETTGAQAGLSGEQQIAIALNELIAKGGQASISDIYATVEKHLHSARLSEQGKASLRRLINTNAVQAGYIYPYDLTNPGWRITPEGREFINAPTFQDEKAIDVDTDQTVSAPANTVRGAAFEQAVLVLIKRMYPHYAWYHQGQHKANERGLDLIGTRIGEDISKYSSIGVQVKLHAPNTAPTKDDWLKFLAGCFIRQVDHAIFVTTGRLSGDQRREAGEGKIIVIENMETIRDLCKTFGVDTALFEELMLADE